MVLCSSYLPPISWFAMLMQGGPIEVEQWENFTKQTIRNRCQIDSPNGPLNLTVPVDKSNFAAGGKCLMKDVRISYHLDWQHQHWNALETTYFNSPFFEYLQDDFRPFYEKKWNWLMDLNEELIMKCCELIGDPLSPTVSSTSMGSGLPDSFGTFLKRTVEYKGVDFDPVRSPLPIMREVPEGRRGAGSMPYYQVFSHKHGFLPNLSIIDLIFNLGPESLLYLSEISAN